MALRKFIYIDPTYGYHDEQADEDSLSLGDLTLDGTGAGSGTLNITGGGTITGLPLTPSGATEATSKSYVDSLTGGVTWKDPVHTIEMKDDSLSAPPGSPVEGDSYLIDGQSGGPFSITAVNTSTETFTVTGDHSGLGSGDKILVEGSTGNDGYWTVASTSGTGPTDITVSEDVTDATGDGTVDYADPGTAWDTIGKNYMVVYDGSAWDTLHPVDDGDRVVVHDTGAAGGLAGQENDIATFVAATRTWTFESPSDGWAVLIHIHSPSAYWDGLGFTYDSTPDDWINFTGLGQVNAGAGLTKSGQTLDIGNGDGITVNADNIELDLFSSNPGLELTGTSPDKQLRVLVSGTEGIVTTATGVAIEIDDSPNTLDVDADGLKVVGLPSLFEVNDVAVGATVTAANLDDLTDGSNADTLHTHTGLSVDEAQRIESTLENEAAVTTGYAVRYGSVSNQIQHADNGSAAGARVLGIARSGGAISPGTSEVVKHGLCVGALTPHADSFAVNDYCWLGAAGAIRLYANIPTPGRRIRLGIAKNADDLDVQIMDLGRRRV